MSAAETRAAVEKVLAAHADCTLNDTHGSIDNAAAVTGQDAWSCGISLPFVGELEGAERAHVAAALEPLIADARAGALEDAAEDMDRFAEETYAEDIFVRPTSEQYAEINALLKRERGHQLDGIAADVMSRAIRVQANLLRDRADRDRRQP